MNTTAVLDVEIEQEIVSVDPIEEIRLRTWARQNYLPVHERGDNLHPVILDEMLRRDDEN